MIFLVYLGPILCLANSLLALSIEQNSLRTQGIRNPNGISTLTPRLSWLLLGDSRGDSQTAYQLQAASTSERLQNPDLWDTGKVGGPSISALYAGTALNSRSLVYWRVRAWDDRNRATDWSETSTFEIGLLRPSDWSAQWITNVNFQLGNSSLPIFTKSFEVSCTVDKARLYALGLGMQSILVNGEEVTDQVLAPGYSNFNKTLIYTTYDLSTYLVKGSNVVGIELGRGEWDTQPALGGRYMKYTAVPSSLMMIAQLEYTCNDGNSFTLPSDDTWKSSVDGPTLESAWYGGEEYNAIKEIPNWASPDGDHGNWDSATVTTGPPGELIGPLYPPLKIIDRMKPVNITGPVAGQYIIDFGTNFAGWFSLRINEDRGTRVTMWPSERLTSSGAIDQSTTGSPIYDAFTSAGVSQVYRPKFMYHGFRYLGVNLTSPPVLSDAEGLIIRTDSDAVGNFSSSDTMLNDIHRIIDRAIQSNIYTVMTDCPHREKLGWLEQTHLVFQPVTRGYDIQAFGKGVVLTMLDSQTSDGLIPDIAPEFVIFSGGFRDDPNWGNAVVLLPLMLYQTYGELDLLEQAYDAMQLYVDYLASKATNNTLAYGLGDWIAFDTTTPLDITATFGYYEALSGMQTIAAALGKTSDSDKYAVMASDVLDGFQAQFATTISGTYAYGSGSQASNAIAIDMGVVPPEHLSAVTQDIIDSIVNNGNHLSVGEIALPSLFRALRSVGQDDIIYHMMTVPTSPSYAYQVLHGATSLTERWDGPTASCAGCNSLNHFMLGYGDQWLVELSGLSQAQNSSAWETINFSPIFVTNMTSASSSYRTIRGLASASWKLSPTSLEYSILVPVGATGLVTLGLQNLGFDKLAESGVELTTNSHGNGIIKVINGTGTISVAIASGEYIFVAS